MIRKRVLQTGSGSRSLIQFHRRAVEGNEEPINFSERSAVLDLVGATSRVAPLPVVTLGSCDPQIKR